MRRIFIAINLPEEIKDELEIAQNEMAGDFVLPDAANAAEGRPVVRWVPKQNLHITLVFVGDVDESRILELNKVVGEAVKDFQPFLLKLNRICYGPTNQKPPRLIWLELAKNKELLEIAACLKQALIRANILKQADKRPFSGHITLGRIRHWEFKRIEPEERPEIDRGVSLEFEVKSVDIMESKLKRIGAEYLVLQSIGLEK